MATEDPQTPPHQIHYGSLLTPPPTGRIQKRVRFSDDNDEEPQPKKAFPHTAEATFVGNGADTLSRGLGLGSSDSTSTQINTRIFFSNVGEVLTPRNKSESVGPARALEILTLPDGIRFMGLPRDIRRKVYRLLLTVPAIICLRQNRSPYEHIPSPWSNTGELRLLSGLAFTATQHASGGPKSRIHKHQYTNVAILRASRRIYREAKEELYGRNTFELANLTKETSPPADFQVPLLPRGCHRFVTSVCIKGASVYAFRFMIRDGHVGLKDAYRSIQSLVLILELESLTKGYGKKLARQPNEIWAKYVKRVASLMAIETFDSVEIEEKIPAWVTLRVMFDGDKYKDCIDLHRDNPGSRPKVIGATANTGLESEDVKREDLKHAACEAFELLKQYHR